MRKDSKKFASARRLRRAGWSYAEISKQLAVQKSTLHDWLKEVPLSEAQRLRLRKNWEDGLKKARVLAVKAHRQKTKERLAHATDNAKHLIHEAGEVLFSKPILKMLLAFLYLGEGSKKTISTVCLANSDSATCRVFVTLLRCTFALDEKKFRCHLHLRMDQDVAAEIQYWSQLLQIPPTSFLKTQKDQRTKKSPTRDGYHGVCAIYYYDAKIQKDILKLSEVFLDTFLGAYSSVG